MMMMMILAFSKTFAGKVEQPVGRLLVRNWHKEPIQVGWRKPEMGWTKLNFDASCKWKTGRSSIGGVLRNHEAEFLLGYAEPIEARSNSNIAEMVALQRGLELTLENGCSDVWAEGDSMNTYREGNRAADKFAQLGHCFQEPQIWRDNPPHQVLRIVHEDAQGKTFIRKR